jgi:hypothetical protein
MTEVHLKCLLPPGNQSVWAPPLDARDLAVRLEADGVTPSVARQRGFHDVWSMAEEYFPAAQARPEIKPPEAKWSHPIVNYLKGMAFAVPLLACCPTAPLWAGAVTGNDAAAIAIATLASFAVTGGFIQIIGHQGHFYKESRHIGLFIRYCSAIVKAGLLTLLCCAAAGFFLNFYFRWLPLPLLGWCAAFHVGVGAFLLMGGVLYVLDGEILLALSTLLGTGIVLILRSLLGLPLLVLQLAGLFSVSGICIVLALFRFRRLAGKWRERAVLPAWSKLLYSLWPYFAYGCLYYLFLFADRFIAWSAHTESAQLSLLFRGKYETALDICLIAFILQVGWVHAGIARFHQVVSSEQKRYRMIAGRELKDRLLLFYYRNALIFSALAVLSSVLVLFMIHEIHALEPMLLHRVAVLMLVGTPFLVIGLWNIALLFALSRPGLVLAATCSALLANICSGYLISRLLSYDLAIIGFDLGACVLACISGWFCHRVAVNFDYHYFASAT